ncbi:MAG: TadA family conjugal transfer-associated ATPase [Kineosporiaceae bacterium]|nr:TadA family conjugal transfer-associated ATPase [Kineosporiaceae bacterium]
MPAGDGRTRARDRVDGTGVDVTPPAAEDLLAPLRARVSRRDDAIGAGRLTTELGAVSTQYGQVLGAEGLRAAADSVREHTQGLGPLQALADDPHVTDVLVNGGGRIWLDRGLGLVDAGFGLDGEHQVRALAVRLAALAGRRLDESLPWVDARLPGGIRLHAVVPPVAPEGTHISLRTLRGAPADLDALVRAGSVPAAWSGVLAALISARAAFLVTGGTGAGKTTLLAALLSLVPPTERLVLVEDVGELRPRHPHVVRLEARHANVEGRGEVGLDVLVRQALRMRPDRLVVGECRGSEVRDLLAALNTGHSGGCGTLHANAAAEVPARLEALGLIAGLSREGVHAQAAAALDVVVHVRRTPVRREVVELGVVGSDEAGRLVVRRALVRGEDERIAGGPAWPALAGRLGLSSSPVAAPP